MYTEKYMMHSGYTTWICIPVEITEEILTFQIIRRFRDLVIWFQFYKTVWTKIHIFLWYYLSCNSECHLDQYILLDAKQHNEIKIIQYSFSSLDKEIWLYLTLETPEGTVHWERKSSNMGEVMGEYIFPVNDFYRQL